MDTHQIVEADLKKLNRQSFQAEDEAGQRGRDVRDHILADSFKIVRAIYVIEDKPTMLGRVAADTSRRKRKIDDESVKVYGTSAVVTSRVTLKEESGEVVGRFWNTKVFVMLDGRPQCVAWQVVRIP